jgi:aryl-alcohol dehydrogenase-like predicted oxidoreductase
MSLTHYRTLGRSGLVVSPAALGTMTFANAAWGSPNDVSQSIFNAYVDAGGNFIDTADVYAGGQSEQLVGYFMAARKLRDKLVIATKCGFNAQAGNLHASGNGRKNIHRALEGSLRRLQTDYVDMYWMHVYDSVTPVEEVLQTLGDLVRAGKIRYFGFSDLPAWYAVKAATLATAHHVPGPIALQLEYSLTERSIEREHVPAARECGLGIMPWSPLAGGFLSGKYKADAVAESAVRQGRLSGSNPFQGRYTKFTARNRHTLEVVQTIATQLERAPAQVALAWAAAQPGITSLILGASRVAQLNENLAALDLQLSAEHLQVLSQCSQLDVAFPYDLFKAEGSRMVFGGSDVEGWQ